MLEANNIIGAEAHALHPATAPGLATIHALDATTIAIDLQASVLEARALLIASAQSREDPRTAIHARIDTTRARIMDTIAAGAMTMIISAPSPRAMEVRCTRAGIGGGR
jgi:hypothetical protein